MTKEALCHKWRNIGYSQAKNIIDELENLGFIGEYNGLNPRDIYMKDKKMRCNCEKFDKHIKSINDIITLISSKTGNNNVLGKDYEIFKFCPWCGEKLIDINDDV